MWGSRYIDDAVARRVDRSPSTLDFEDVYLYLTATRFSPVTLVDDAGEVAERVSYDPYGKARHHWREDVDGNGSVDSDDQQVIDGLIASAAPYNPFGPEDPSLFIGGANYAAGCF